MTKSPSILQLILKLMLIKLIFLHLTCNGCFVFALGGPYKGSDHCSCSQMVLTSYAPPIFILQFFFSLRVKSLSSSTAITMTCSCHIHAFQCKTYSWSSAFSPVYFVAHQVNGRDPPSNYGVASCEAPAPDRAREPSANCTFHFQLASWRHSVFSVTEGAR